MALPGESLQDKATVFLKKHADLGKRQLAAINSILVKKEFVAD
jgi:hypothetical protein